MKEHVHNTSTLYCSCSFFKCSIVTGNRKMISMTECIFFVLCTVLCITVTTIKDIIYSLGYRFHL